MWIPGPLKTLLEAFKVLPGIGDRSAHRMVFSLLKDRDRMKVLENALKDARESLTFCSVCHGITDSDPCPICRDPMRDNGIICVVENPQDVFFIEQIGLFKGRYHVLGGVLSPLNGIGPRDLYIDHLVDRVSKERPKEVILALSPTVEGDATSYFIAEKLSGFGVKITRIARGMPTGAELSLSDAVTLREAFQGRSEI